MSHLQGDEIIISGVSGLFPNTQNIQELGEKLFNKVDLVRKRNTYYADIKHPELPDVIGKIYGMEQFDAHFFRVTERQAECLDPTIGKLLEHTFSALFDAGINPVTLKGSKIGVFIAATQIESANLLYNYETNINPFRITGTNKTMLANRISYWIDGKGPSYSFDNGCAGSMAALETAYNSIKNGEVECAIVGGSNFCIIPELTLNMKRAGLLCLDGKTKCFDKTGGGFVRSDAINVYLLQKAKDAKRIYAEVYHVKGKYFASPDGLFSPTRNPQDIEKFLNEFYSEIDVSPADVEYVEANSFGIVEADGNELEAIGNVFAKNKIMKIGSVKSNMGNTEAVSGACSISKMCLAYQKGLIPANLHYNEPQNDINAVKEGKLQVLTENTPFSRNLTAINNFCFTGINFHTLLKGHYKPKNLELYKSSIPRLALVSGRKDDDVNKILDILETNPIDAELFALLNNFFKYYVPGHTGRGYIIIDSIENNKTACLSRGFEFYSGNRRPVWFLFSGMGSQWAGMGKELLRVPVFASAIEKCHKILLPKGLDIIKILTEEDDGIFNILNTIVAITAVQIGLCDVLTSLGIVPDNIIGHSVGEIACAYADGSLTAEETILASYYRGLAAYESKLIKGAMAAVGLGHEEVAKLCPLEIDIACHNSSTSTTISGPADLVTEFVKSLTDQGIFAKEVNSYNIAFHSRYIAEAGPKMLAFLKNVITNPKPRSKKWLSTCYRPEEWHKPESQFVTAEYLVHNLLGNVLFEESAKFIPDDALIIEIAPHGLLQAIMKRSHSQCVNLSLTRRGETDGAELLLKAIGKLYHNGLNPDLESLYPKVEFPVSTETSMLSHYIGWDYHVNWENYNIDYYEDESLSAREFTISIDDDDFAYFKDYVRNGDNVIPEAAMLVFVWETLADLKKMNYKDMSVKFQNIKIHKQITIKPEEILQLEITIQKVCNKFEVSYKNNVIVDGFINVLDKNIYRFDKIHENEKHFTQTEIYAIMRSRGYSYVGEFQSIISSNINRDKASVKWNNQWVTFLDSIIQLQALSNDHDGVSCVEYISQLIIDTDEHKFGLVDKKGVQHYNALILKDIGVTRCGGIIFRDLIYNDIPKLEIVPEIQKILKINILNHDNHSELDIDNMPVGSKNKTQRVVLIAKEPDNIESLAWTEGPMISNKAMIQVSYSGISTKDCKNLSSSDNKFFGLDFSGYDRNGMRVMGILPRGALASTVEADHDLLWPVPQHWSMAEAATVPLPFLHAFYCIKIMSFVPNKSNILVIGAAGALGQAVISIALSLGCTIFGTVANADKKRFLLKLFPELDVNNIGYTYDSTFMAMVSKRTRNERCAVVISSGSGKIRETAMACVGFSGNFLDVNDSDQKDYKSNLPMYFLKESKSYISVNLSTIFNEKYSKYKKVLHSMLSEGIAKGYVRPLTSVIFSPSDVIKAFKVLSTRTNRGRVLIKMDAVAMFKQDFVQISRLTLYPTKYYIVLWDGSELGVELIDLLIKRGARRLFVHCNPKLMNGLFHVKYKTWSKLGAIIELNSNHLQGKDKCESLIKITESKLGLLDGIFITWNDVVETKNIFDEKKENIATIVYHLDIASRNSKNLRYFGIVTTVSQDVVSENVLKEIETCCLRRKELGLPSLFLHHSVGEKVLQQKFIAALLNILEISLKHKYVHVSTSYTTGHDVEEDKNIAKIKLNTDFEAGLLAFYRHISVNEIDGSEPIIRMKTKLCSGSEPEMTIDPEDSHIIIIPGFEGNSESLTSLSERLNKRAIVMQLDPSNNYSIPNIAKNLLKYVKARIHIKSPFYIMGYSFGANVALEMAALLEKEGLLGVVYCLDSSPDAVRVHLDSYLGNLTDEQLQNCLIEHIYKLLVGNKSDKLKEKINEITKWSEKLEIFISKVKHDVHHSHEYLMCILNAAFDRIKLAKEYKPTFKLHSKLVLLKGIPHPNARNLNDDYNLSMYTDKPVTVLDIESDHAMAQFDRRVSNYINRFFVL